MTHWAAFGVGVAVGAVGVLLAIGAWVVVEVASVLYEVECD